MDISFSDVPTTSAKMYIRMNAQTEYRTIALIMHINKEHSERMTNATEISLFNYIMRYQEKNTVSRFSHVKTPESERSHLIMCIKIIFFCLLYVQSMYIFPNY